jgi:putative ABC transport system permease protein
VYDDSLKVRVSGIVKDPQQNTDLLFTDFISYSTRNSRFSSWAQPDMRAWVFMKLIPGTTVTTINAQLNTLIKKHAGSEARVALRLQSLSDMHFDADIIENPIRTAHRPTLYTLMAIAAFILLLAVINFINLSTAQSLQRAKEVGIRKVLGSNRRLLILQFMTETTLLTLVAVLLATALVKPVLAAFSSFIPETLDFDVDGATLLFLFCVTLITSVLAGLYPSRIIAAQLPAWILKGNSTNPATGNRLLRKGLIVFQFSVSLIFIIGSIVIAKQLNYTREKDLGFSAEGIITIESPRGENISRVALLEQEVKQVKGVRRVARQWLSPMSENPRGMKLKFNSTDQKDFWVTQVAGNENFIPLYKIRLLAGRNLERADSVKELVINESLSKLMGDSNPYASLNKILYWNDRPYPVVGVVADFHTASLHDPVTPLCLINRPDREGALAIKLSINKSTITEVEAAWKKIYPAAPFNFQFFDETLAQLYARDRQTATLINTAMVVTIFISCIGLFGLVLFTSKKRAKEISIRKVLGAGAGDIMVMLGKEFVILVIIAILIAAPTAWYFMNEWLQGFSYRISIDAWMIGIAGLIGLSVALLTTGYHSIKAAMVNPVENLRGN